MSFFDFHCHTSLKPMFADENNRPDCWQPIQVAIDDILGNIIDSQSALTQLLDGGTNLACISLYPLEVSVANRNLLEWADALMLNNPNVLSRELLKKIARAEPGYRYNDLMEKELTNLKRVANNPNNNSQKIKFINTFAEYNAADKNTLHIILSVEGGHSFCYGQNEYDDSAQMIANLKKFKSPTSEHRLLYITLVHLEQSGLANHAYGNKIFDKTPFVPKGDGLTKQGIDFIRECYSTKDGEKPVMIDIKHLSIKSRKQLYDLRRNEFPDMPVLATHSGVTGVSWYARLPIRRYFESRNFTEIFYDKPQGHIDGTMFNPISINLYDEDIREIIQSNGLIGLILDERILGAGATMLSSEIKPTEKEFISNQEFDEVVQFEYPHGIPGILRDLIQGELEEIETIRAVLNVNRNKVRQTTIHPKYVFNTIVHIHKVGKSVSRKPLDHLCIGSDFDGLINPVDNCVSADQMHTFSQELVRLFDTYGPQFGIVGDSNELVEGIMFKNAHRFLGKYFA